MDILYLLLLYQFIGIRHRSSLLSVKRAALCGSFNSVTSIAAVSPEMLLQLYQSAPRITAD